MKYTSGPCDHALLKQCEVENVVRTSGSTRWRFVLVFVLGAQSVTQQLQQIVYCLFHV